MRTRDILSRAPVSRQASRAERREYWVDLNAAARRRPVVVFESVEDEAEDDDETVIADTEDEVAPPRVTREMVL